MKIFWRTPRHGGWIILRACINSMLLKHLFTFLDKVANIPETVGPRAPRTAVPSSTDVCDPYIPVPYHSNHTAG